LIITLQSRSSITVPRELREKLGIGPGDLLDAVIDHGRLVLTPVAVVPRTLSLTESGLRKEADVDEDIKRGRVKSFTDEEALLKHLGEDDE